MEFNELIADFAKRHKVENLVAVDGAAALDIDGIIVTIVAKGDLLNFSAEIGEPPADGAALFANLLLTVRPCSPISCWRRTRSPTRFSQRSRIRVRMSSRGGFRSPRSTTKPLTPH